MKQYEEVFFGALRTALFDRSLLLPEGFAQWKKVLKLARQQACSGLVGDTMLMIPQILDTLPSDISVPLQEMPLDMMARYATANNALIVAVTALRKNGIDPVLLKGQGVSRYYPFPALREHGDIDLYVGVDNYEKAYDALLPVVTEIDAREELQTQAKHFHAKIGSVAVEVHRYAAVFDLTRENALYQEYARKGLTENLVPLDLGSIVVDTPAEDFNVYFVFNHLLHHFYSTGIGMRQLCDLTMLLHAKNGQYDVETLRQMLAGMDEMMPWQVFGCVIVDVLGLPEEEFPFYNPSMRRRADRLLKSILMEGNFGHNTPYVLRPEWGFFRRKFESFRYSTTRICRVALIFPKAMFFRFYFMILRGVRVTFRELATGSRT